MSDVNEDTMPIDEPGRRRIPRWVFVIGGILLLIVVIVLASLGLRGQNDDPGAAGTVEPTSSASASPSETPAEPTTEPDPSASAEPGATETPAGETPAAETPAAETPAPGTPPGDPAVGTPEEPAPLDEPSQAVPGVTIAIADLAAVEGEPRGAGELAGPALRFAVNVTNTDDEAAALGTVVVNLYYGEDETPAPPVTGPNGSNLPAEVAAGQTASGAYIFTVPEDQRDRVRIEVDYSTEAGVVVFEGAAPR
ncbi:hypothetical protein ACFDTO_03985 [Microbacteriaceae bacterium 4G12]